jgi:hypothetical protein
MLSCQTRPVTLYFFLDSILILKKINVWHIHGTDLAAYIVRKPYFMNHLGNNNYVIRGFLDLRNEH